MGTAFLHGNGGGTAAGATLAATSPSGVTVTLSNDTKTYSKVSDSSGNTIFKGLSTGTWTLTITDGSRSATTTVEIVADYTAVIAFFSATINITYPSGSTCTAADGSMTLTAPDTSGTWECAVPNTGTWTITSTDGENSSSKQVEITTDGQNESIALSYSYYIVNAGGSAQYTGGWTKGGNASGGVNSDGGIYLKTTSSASGSVTMTTGISDFAKYSTLKIVQSTKVNSHYFRLIDSDGNILAEETTYTSDSPVVIDLTSLNLSSTSLYKFRIYGGAIGGTSGATTTVTQVWLE